MRYLIWLTFVMCAGFVYADDDGGGASGNGGSGGRGSAESDVPIRLSDLPWRINPQIGISEFEYTGQGGGRGQLAGGATLEVAGPIYRGEFGFMLMGMTASASWSGEPDRTSIHDTWLTLPIALKARLFSTARQNWSLKVGVLQVFELASNKNEATNRTDVLATLGVAGAFGLSEKTDVIIEGSYNRGLLPALRQSGADSFHEGTLVLAGVSFRL